MPAPPAWTSRNIRPLLRRGSLSFRQLLSIRRRQDRIVRLYFVVAGDRRRTTGRTSFWQGKENTPLPPTRGSGSAHTPRNSHPGAAAGGDSGRPSVKGQ